MTPTFAKLKVFLCCTICTASVALLLASYNHLERNEMISEHYSTSPYRIAFDGSLESSLERARGLTSESVQSHALAMIAETEERGEQKLLSLKKEMTALVAERAQQMSQRAIEAWADADDAKKRLVSIRNQIKNLKQDAQTKRVEAGERESLANKLFSKAKELGIEAKGIQRQKFISEYGTSDGPPAVSPQALQLLREEAVRDAELMRKDAAALRNAKAERLQNGNS